MTPILALLLFLLAASVWVLVGEIRQIRSEDLLWKKRRAKLLALNSPSVTSYKEDWLSFQWAPGAQWIVDDPASVSVLKDGAILARLAG